MLSFSQIFRYCSFFLISSIEFDFWQLIQTAFFLTKVPWILFRKVSSTFPLQIAHFILLTLKQNYLNLIKSLIIMKEIGGQALIEGVLMLSPKKIGIALRKNKKIITKVENRNQSTKTLKKIPFVRGIVALFEMLVIGTKALLYSTEVAADEKDQQVTKTELFFTLLFSIGLAIGLFIALPLFFAKLFTAERYAFNLLDGIFRILIFVLYLGIIGLFKDIKRVYQYHGAEHMAVHCHENNLALTVDNVKKFPPEHPRCGTAFILIVLVISILLFSLVWHETWLIKFLQRILLIPVIASISYEILKISAKVKILNFLTYPGLWLQKLTTRQPKKDQIEVAIAAIKKVL